jgi:hypothetical protein
VLEKHKHFLDPDISIDEPVKVIDKARGIVDLMFSRAARRHRADEFEQLVVELKAPRVKIGANEITQANQYALAVQNDERFHTVKGVRWHFWLVSNDYDAYAKHVMDTGPDPERRLISKGANLMVGIRTWGELIEENRARLQFFQEHLEHSVDQGAALAYLREQHSQYLEGVFVDEDVEASDETSAADEAAGDDEIELR